MNSKYFISLIICAFQLAALQAQDIWELQQEENGIKVYTKEVDASDFKPFKATVLLGNTVEEFVSVLYDIEGMKDWAYKVKSSFLLEKPSDTLQIYYAEAKAPFPYKNRDGVYQNKLKWKSETKTLLVEIEILNDYKNVNEDLVAIKGYGYWSATLLNTGKLEVTFMMEVDPGGRIPAWMANMVVEESPYYTLLNLKEVINKSKYSGNIYSFID